MKKTTNRPSHQLMHPVRVPDGFRSRNSPRGYSNNSTGVGGFGERRGHIWSLMPGRIVCAAPTRSTGRSCGCPPANGSRFCVHHGGGPRHGKPANSNRAIYNRLVKQERRAASRTLAALIEARALHADYREQLAAYAKRIYPADLDLFGLRLDDWLNGRMTGEEWWKTVQEFQERRERWLGSSWRGHGDFGGL